GAGLSLAWVGVVGAALVTLDTAITLPRLRVLSAVAAGVALGICAVPALTAFHANRSVLTNGPESTLPAYVAAQAAGDRPLATLVMTPQNDGGLAVEVVWGASETLGSQTTMVSTAMEPQGEDIATLAVDLLSARDFDAPGELAAKGISYVLLSDLPGSEGDKARTLRTAAIASIDQRAGLVHAGESDRGVLWRLEAEIAAPPTMTSADEGRARLVLTIQLLAVFVALLLSIPTRASRRAARAQSRIVGRAPEEPIVLPRHAEDQSPLEEPAPVGAIEEPQDEAALNDEALMPIAEPEPSDEEPSESVDARSVDDEERPETTVEGDR
ncbi:MAG: glycosyl transferase, partial [Microbacterium sp.]|nr:glycosyl transferase [Microbacterium sp.]